MLELAKNHLNTIGSIFGGYAELTKIIPEEQLGYLVIFPGNIFVTAPWTQETEPVDLTQIGFREGSILRVYSYYWDTVYVEKSTGIFGSSSKDQELLEDAYHGEIFHLVFEVDGEETICLLWIAKELDPISKERIIKKHQKNQEQKFSRLSYNEIILYSSFEEPVAIYSLKGSWSEALSPNAIETSKNTKVKSYERPQTIYFQPEPYSWYAFKIGPHWLQIKELQGIGLNNWKVTGAYSYYFEPFNIKNIRSSLSNSDLLKDSVLYNNSNIQLKGELVLPPSINTSTIEISVNTSEVPEYKSNLIINATTSLASSLSNLIVATLGQIETSTFTPSVNIEVALATQDYSSFYLLNLPKLDPLENLTARLYAYSSANNLKIYRNQSGTLIDINVTLNKGVYGRVVSLPANNNHTTINYNDSFVVELADSDMLLESVSQEDFLEGDNLAVVGNEVLSFKQAVQIGPRTFELKDLVRGLRGTEHFITNLTLNDTFVLGTSLKELPLTISDLDQTLNFRGIRTAQIVANAPDNPIFYTGLDLTPYSVANLRVIERQANLVKVAWTRRTRANGLLNDVGEVPLGESSLNFAIEIRLISNPAILVESNNTGATEYTYIGSPQDKFISIKQIGDYKEGPVKTLNLA